MTPAELAQHVKRLEITTRHAVTQVLAGEYSSAFKGRGMEFSEVLEYQPGEDVRAIDWNVTARAGKPYVKRFVEERELTVILAVDLSASGRFGSQPASKQDLAVEAAALLAFAAQRNRDRVGLLLFTDQVELFVPAKKDPRHALRLIREMLSFTPRGRGTDFRVAADHLAQVVKRRAIIFVISDFLTGTFEEPLRRLRRSGPRHDVVALDVCDPRESSLPRAGVLELFDPETGRNVLVDTSSSRVRAAYAATAQQRQSRLAESLRLAGVDRVTLATDRPYVHELAAFFQRRERRR
jgi:uncharacterized protein (DUF58 family)